MNATVRPIRFIFSFLLALSTAEFRVHGADVNSIWNGGTGNWSVATNWTPNASYPNNGALTYNARVSAGTVTLTEPISIQQYTNAGGTLTGDFPLTINELFTWSGGTISGNSAINAAGGMALTTAGGKTLTGRTIHLGPGIGTWSAGTINIGSSAILNVLAAGQFDCAVDATFNVTPTGTSATITNAGAFRKTGGTGTTTVEPVFNNVSGGTVTVASGILSLTGGGISSGSFNASAGTTLSFSGGTHSLDAGSSVRGAGTNRVTAGTFNMAGTYDMTGGVTVVSGGTANFTGASTRPGALALSGAGAINFNTGSGTALPVASAIVSGGTLGGSDSLEVASPAAQFSTTASTGNTR